MVAYVVGLAYLVRIW